MVHILVNRTVRLVLVPLARVCTQIHSWTDQSEGHALIGRWRGLRTVILRIFIVSAEFKFVPPRVEQHSTVVPEW